MSRRTLRLTLRGLVAVHAARAAHTALGTVPGIESATVTLAGAEVDFAGVYGPDEFFRLVSEALVPIGIELVTVETIQERVLPLA